MAKPTILVCVLVWGLIANAVAHEVCLEAEDLKTDRGWRVITGYEGYMPSEPDRWSGNRLRADASDEPAKAQARFEVPAAGTYHLWVHFESAYGFDSLFTVEIRQGRRTRVTAELGGKEQSKYFLFGRGWQVQGPWHYHNADWVYQKAAVTLDAGPATLTLKKGRNGRPAGLRVLDFLYLTDDLALEPGDDFRWGRTRETAPPILGRFQTSAYVKVQISPKATKSALVQVQPRFWQVGYYMGPRDTHYFTPAGLTTKKPAEDAWLAPGAETEWAQIRLHKVYPAILLVRSTEPAEVMICQDPEHPKDTLLTASIRPADPSAPSVWRGEFNGLEVTQIIVSTGNTLYEKAILQGRFARVFDEYLEEVTASLEAMEVPHGRKATRLHLLSVFPPRVNRFDMRRLASALGINGQYGQCSASVYGPEGQEMGFVQDRGFIAIHNAHLRLSGCGTDCYEGNYDRLRQTYQKRYEELKKAGVGHLPQTIKLIEEAGAPSFGTLRTWDKINEQFRAYLKQHGVKPPEVLSRESLAELLATDRKPTEEEMWQAVTVGAGSPAEAETNPVLFYHSHCFRALLFARNCAGATRLVEEIFPTGSRAHSGSFLPSTGSMPVLAHGTDPFLLFKERGVSAYSSEISWGLNLPDYLGPQMHSYESALSRALAKYHQVPRGSYLISDRNRGYPPDFVELVSYVFAVTGFDFWNYYTVYYPEGCSVVGIPETLQAIRRANYTIGAVEAHLEGTEVVPAKVALGWSLTSDVWDMSHPQPEPAWSRAGNTIYAGERAYLYLLLRHLQSPVDLLSEADLTDGYLGKYSVYILAGDHLRPEAAEALKQWVEKGGTLVSVAGGGFLDHCNRPLDTLKEVFGIESARLEKKAESLRPKLELIHTPPLDTLTLTGNDRTRTMPVVGYRQTFKVSSGKTVAVYRDGRPAAVRNAYGQGQALILGTLPGHAYLFGAFPLLPFGRGGEDLSSIIYPNYNRTVRDALGTALSGLLPVPPVEVSDPLVEAWVLRHRESGAYSVGLVNFTGSPLGNLEVRVDAAALGGEIKKASSPFQEVRSRVDNGRLVVTMQMPRLELLQLR